MDSEGVARRKHYGAEFIWQLNTAWSELQLSFVIHFTLKNLISFWRLPSLRLLA